MVLPFLASDPAVRCRSGAFAYARRDHGRWSEITDTIGGRSVLDDLEYDDSEPPTIGLVRAGVPWADVRDHIKIAHSTLLVLAEGTGQYVGVYWTGTKMVVTDDLGSEQDQAICEFRGFLVERGEM